MSLQDADGVDVDLGPDHLRQARARAERVRAIGEDPENRRAASRHYSARRPGTDKVPRQLLEHRMTLETRPFQVIPRNVRPERRV